MSLEEAQAVSVALQALRAPETAPMGHELLATLVRARGLERMERALAGHPAATH